MKKFPYVLFLFVIWVFCISSAPAMAETLMTRSFPLPEHGTLKLIVPDSWNADVQSKGNLPPTIRFSPKSGSSFSVLLTPLWPANKSVTPPDAAKLKQGAQRSLDALKTQAVEQDLQLVELRGSQGPGYYFSLTDRDPKPNEFKLLTQGVIRISDLTTTFTILTNDGQRNVTEDALAMIKGAVHVTTESTGQPSGGIQSDNGKYRISKESDLYLEFPSSDFKIKIERHKPERKLDYYMLTSESRKLNVSFTIEPATKCLSSSECRDLSLNNPEYLNPRNLKKYHKNGFEIAEFECKLRVEQLTLDQMNLLGHIVSGGYWIDMHISKVKFNALDKQMFEDFVKSIYLYMK
jgi:hypothetical protein